MFFEERVAWIIKKIKEKENLTNVQVGQKLGVNKNTVAAYCQGKGDLKGVALAGIVKHFGISGEWLIAGHGEPFPGARRDYIEVCGPEKAHLYNKDAAALPAGDAQRINIEEAMGKTYKVLTSETPYVVALYLNVQQFSNAVDATKELSTCQDRITNLETQVGALRSQVDRMTAPPITSEQQEASLAKEAM